MPQIVNIRTAKAARKAVRGLCSLIRAAVSRRRGAIVDGRAKAITKINSEIAALMAALDQEWRMVPGAGQPPALWEVVDRTVVLPDLGGAGARKKGASSGRRRA